MVGTRFPKYGDLRWLWATRSPTLEARRGVAVLFEVMYHMDIVQKEMRGMRKVWVAREVVWQVVGTRLPKYGDLRWLWATRSPTLEAWAGLAMFSKVRYHMNLVPKEMRGMRKVWVARAVSWQVVGTRFPNMAT